MKAVDDFNSKKDYQEYLRTYAAISAMNGILSNPKMMDVYSKNLSKPIIKVVSEDAIQHADDLLEELSKTPKP